MRKQGTLKLKRNQRKKEEKESGRPRTFSSRQGQCFCSRRRPFSPPKLGGDVKKLLANKTGLQPEEQQLFFRGEEKYNEETLYVEGLKAFEAVVEVRAEVDELAERVFVLKVAADRGTRVSDKEFKT
ncbi:hypothetical protein V8G54_011617 [Vigna mungo]|uniref:Ubiquitin-like domain-containing protein n=1 Tax=Vigna mungo TaxID=3915 RepID=A0AAQ3NPY7_VIGMU